MKRLSKLLFTIFLFGIVHIGLSQTNWNAYNDFYFDSTNYINNSPGTPIPFPTSPSATGRAWGYYECNANGVNGYPGSIGVYFAPGGNTASGQVLLAMANYQPLGPCQGQIGGGVGTTADAWDATGGSGWARYGDDNGWGTSIGEYGGAWYSGAPGYGTAYATNTGLYLQPGYLGAGTNEGICSCITWTAPSDGTYTFSGSFLIANSGGSDYAIVDSEGGVDLPKTIGNNGTYNSFSFQKTLKARDVVEFQVGTDGQSPAAVGFNCNIQLVQITDWNAFNDFYFDSTNYLTNSPGNWIPFPRSAPGSPTRESWGYYDANCNWYGGYPSNIGSYFGPTTLYALANYQPLGPAQGQIAGGVGTTKDAWDATPGDGNGFARYVDVNGWGTSLGEYGGAWFSAAPGYGTSYGTNDGIWMQAGWLGATNGEGICPVVTWTAPQSGTYNFHGSFLIGNNGTSGPDGANCDYAIVDSLGGIEVPRAVVPQGTYNAFSFQKAFNAGDVVEFQVGTDFQIGAAVGFNCIASSIPVPAVLVSAIRSVTNDSLISVKFNAPLYGPSVGNLTNYSIDGMAVTSAEQSPTDPSTIFLTIAPGLDYPKTLTVNGVENDFGHLPVATNSTALITVPVYVPDGIGTPTNAFQDTFSGANLASEPYWQSGAVNDDPTQSNYIYSQVFVESNGVLHVHCDTLAASPANYWDPNYLIYVNPAYEGTVEEALMHIKIINSNFSPSGVAGLGLCVQPDPYTSSPAGGDCFRAVPGGYASGPGYPHFLGCSDFVADESPTNGIYGIPWQIGGSYWLRIRTDIDTNPATDGNPGAIVSTKIWAGDGSEPEPTNWMTVWKDPLPSGDTTRSGYAAIRAGFGTSAIMDFDVDYFMVSAAGLPTITPTLPASLVPQITLGIATGGGNAVLSWPAGVGAGYSLQARTSLTSGSWNAVNAPVVVNGLENTVTVPFNGQEAEYFRLIQQ